MAFYAEMKRRNWYCICGIDMITEYRRFLYNEWYNSLTEDQKAILEENRKRREEQRQRELNTALAKLTMMSGMVAGLYARTNHENSYGDEYDSFESFYG